MNGESERKEEMDKFYRDGQKPAVGDWIRYYLCGILVIEQVMSIQDAQTFPVRGELYTAGRTVKIEDVVEVRKGGRIGNE